MYCENYKRIILERIALRSLRDIPESVRCSQFGCSKLLPCKLQAQFFMIMNIWTKYYFFGYSGDALYNIRANGKSSSTAKCDHILYIIKTISKNASHKHGTL